MRDLILKARQQGFSSGIGALFATDFILEPNSTSMVLADTADNASALLQRVKLYLKSWEEKNGFKLPLKYNSRNELHNEAMNSWYIIGSAENPDVGRSRTIRNLHLSEIFFYKKMRSILAGVMQAVTPDGYVVGESTANGFNEGKEFWDASVAGETGFNPLFYKASDFYDAAFLEAKKKELGRLFRQEYPETPIEAFLTSGDQYFNAEALERYLEFSTAYQQLVNTPIYA